MVGQYGGEAFLSLPCLYGINNKFYIYIYACSALISHIFPVLSLLNSCVLYWSQRWKYYGLGYQMQQKRYQLLKCLGFCFFMVV